MAQYEEITLDQGADATIELHLVDTDGSKKNLINHTVTAKLKKNYADSSGEATDFTTTVSDVLMVFVLYLLPTFKQTLLRQDAMFMT